MSAPHAARPPVIAIALDAMSPMLLEQWLDAGHAPVLARLRREGALGRLGKSDWDPNEASWSIFLQGASPGRTGMWGHLHFDPAAYDYRELPIYEGWSEPPFYQRAPQARVAVLDIPFASPERRVDGVQVLGWGPEANQFIRISQPPELMAELVARHGVHPAYDGLGQRKVASRDGAHVLSFRVPSLYDEAALSRLEHDMLEGIRRRGAILEDLLRRERWDLLLAAFAEPHVCGHMLWHFGLPHPMHLAVAQPGLLRVFQAIDAAIGRLLPLLPDDAVLVLFSVSGMKENCTDVPLTLFLPEALLRLEFGEAGLAEGVAGAPVPPPRTDYRQHWKDEVWALRTPFGERMLQSPDEQGRRGDPLDWNPTNWSRGLWPRMRAFVLPSYLQGMIRINVAGREGAGVVAPSAFGAECDRVESMLRGLVDARTGRALVRDVMRTRSDPFDTGLGGHPADLLVVWTDRDATDCVEGPGIGRIGPVPQFRSGGHAQSGFCLARGPGIAAGSALPDDARVVDLSATLVQALGVTPPPAMEGRALW